MKQIFNYQPNSLSIFEGFYESYLYYSDKEYDYNYNREDLGPECEIDDFREFCNEVCEMVAEKLSDYFDDDICDSCTLQSMTSPKYYNFTTDKINLKLNIDIEAIKQYIVGDKDRLAAFDKYLKRKYTSCDGYISFVSNNADSYFNDGDFDRYTDVAIDYYLLTKIYDDTDVVDAIERDRMTEYHYDIYDSADEIFYRHMVPIIPENDDNDNEK